MGVMGHHFTDVFKDDKYFQLRLVPFYVIWFLFGIVLIAWLFMTLFVPNPRKPRLSEKTFTTVDRTGDVTDPEPLPCWYDDILRKYAKAKSEGKEMPKLEQEIDPAELFMTVVVPAFNEEDRLTGMLEEAVNYLETEYGTTEASKQGEDTTDNKNSTTRRRKPNANGITDKKPALRGWEILLVNDGSTDNTNLTAQTFSRNHILAKHPRRASGPWTHRSEQGVKIPPGAIRMISLEENRGKGGAVTHGMRHARGQYVVFADADGASKFTDLDKLVSACENIEDGLGRGVAVGSRAHLVGSEAVVKRSKLRNFLMHSFHLLLKLMTPPQTARIKDTQCGFKLFSRATLPYIIPHMHMDGWIFDVEMLMLAEFAGIPVAEVPVGWREVVGSKLNVIKDSIGMAWGLAILRICWGTGIYRR